MVTAVKVSRFRQAVPQILACMIKNLLIFDLGLAYGFATVLIPAMRGIGSANDSGQHIETLHFTALQSSWYGSIGLLTEPLASLVSGWFTDTLGRRRTMVLVNLPHIVAWLMMWRATTVAEVFVAGALLGLGIGLMESCVIAYVGEISHQSIRGPLLVLSSMCGIGGVCSMYLIGVLLPWRQAALLCLCVPCVALLLICFVPETPYWLLVRGRRDEALRSLCWLRGWVTEPHVRDEFAAMELFVRQSNACPACQKLQQHRAIECSHPSGYWRRCREMRRPNCARPLAIVALCFLLSHTCGMSALRPFLVQIVTVYRVPFDASHFAVVTGLLEFVAFGSVLAVLRWSGKRNLLLVCSAVAGVAVAVLAGMAFVEFPVGATSFDVAFVNAAASVGERSVWALAMFVVMAFFAGAAAGIPWMLVAEMYPIRVRAAAVGISAAFCYISLFATTKSYLFLEEHLSIGGAFAFYVCMTLVLWIGVYLVLPETEGRTLQEIEAHFSAPEFRATAREIRSVECTAM